MDTNEIKEAELSGLRRLTLDDSELRETRERRVLLHQSVLDEREHLAALDRRKEWVQNFNMATSRLEQAQQQAQSASRVCASYSKERKDLALYDHLAPLRPLYERILTLQELLTRVRDIYNENDQQRQAARLERDAARTAADVARQREVDATEAHHRRLADINAGYHIEGTISALEGQLRQSETILRQLQLTLSDKEKSLREIRAQEAESIKLTEAANTQLKGLSAHSVMLSLYDLVKDKLSAMGKERAANEKLHSQQASAQREREMLLQSMRQREGELTAIEHERDEYRSKLLLLNQSADTVLDIVRAPIIRDDSETQRQLDKFLGLRSHIRQIEEQLQVAELQLAAKRTQIEELNTEAAVSNSHRLAIEQAMRESDTEVASLYSDLDKIITLSGWFTEWQRNPDALRARISELYHNWQDARTSYAEHARSSTLLRSSLAAAEQGVSEARQQEIQQRNVRDSIRRDLEDQRERLRATFGELTPSELEKSLSTDLDQALSASKEAAERLSAAQKVYNKSKSRQEIILQLQQALQEKLRQESAQLDLWIENHNSNSILLQRSIVEEAFRTENNWDDTRRRLTEADITEAVTNARLELAQRVLGDLQRDAATDKPGPNDAPAQIYQQRIESQRRLESFEADLREVEGQLYAHNRALYKMEILQRR
ncbi:MAG: hypothetical protein MJZ40_04945 [Bacteroidaceae bacterium]|nr:hypothetical protein [Bacteroidaceae bacterium]